MPTPSGSVDRFISGAVNVLSDRVIIESDRTTVPLSALAIVNLRSLVSVVVPSLVSNLIVISLSASVLPKEASSIATSNTASLIPPIGSTRGIPDICVHL